MRAAANLTSAAVRGRATGPDRARTAAVASMPLFCVAPWSLPLAPRTRPAFGIGRPPMTSARRQPFCSFASSAPRCVPGWVDAAMLPMLTKIASCLPTTRGVPGTARRFSNSRRRSRLGWPHAPRLALRQPIAFLSLLLGPVFARRLCRARRRRSGLERVGRGPRGAARSSLRRR